MRWLPEPLWSNLIKQEDPLIVEVGCNDGTDTLRLLQMFPRAHLLCFEPEPRAIARFREHVHSDRVTLLELAVTNRCGYHPWYASHGTPPRGSLMTDWDLSGSLKRPTGHIAQPHAQWCTFTEEGHVWCVSLDDIIGPARRVDLLRVDVQGGESELIEGATAVLANTRFFYTEFYDPALNCHDYDLAELYENGTTLLGLLRSLPATGEWRLCSFHEGGNLLLENVAVNI